MDVRSRILVVDDEQRGVELLARTLRSLGRVETAVSGEQAWKIARQGQVELVVTDQRMPGLSGVELLSRVADRDEHVGRVLLTGYADLSATVDAINQGRVHAYLHKPCAPDQVRSVVKAVLERIRLSRENARLVTELSEKNREIERAQRSVVESERLAAIGRMIAMIVHDLRGPLTVLRSAGSEVQREGTRQELGSLRELGGEILEEVERMQRRCTELLEETRVSRGALARREEELDAVVEAAMLSIGEDAGRRGVRLELALESRARVLLDEDRLRRALLNLAFNALEAMPEGGVLRVSTTREPGAAEVRVRDSGAGIPEEIRDRIFEPFVSAGKREGSGLGLAVVKKVVEDHGGSIAVDKAEGGGSLFTLRLPVAGAAASSR